MALLRRCDVAPEPNRTDSEPKKRQEFRFFVAAPIFNRIRNFRSGTEKKLLSLGRPSWFRAARATAHPLVEQRATPTPHPPPPPIPITHAKSLIKADLKGLKRSPLQFFPSFARLKKKPFRSFRIFGISLRRPVARKATIVNYNSGLIIYQCDIDFWVSYSPLCDELYS